MTKTTAQAEARKLLRRMMTPGWEIGVWENMGWHFELRNGGLKLYEFRDRSSGKERAVRYHCLLSRFPGSGGDACWLDSRSHADPNEAVAAQLKMARDYRDVISAAVAQLEKNLGGKFPLRREKR